jgi:hypothetical protein
MRRLSFPGRRFEVRPTAIAIFSSRATQPRACATGVTTSTARTTPTRSKVSTPTGQGRGSHENTHFEDSKVLYPPLRIAPDGVPRFDDDLRLRQPSPARHSGLTLSDPNIGINDPLAVPLVPPDLGCYEFDGPGLDVGVDSRRRFPERSE